MRILRLWVIHHPRLAVAIAAVTLLATAQAVPSAFAQPAGPDIQAMWAACQAYMAQLGGTMSNMMGAMGSAMGSMMGPMHGMGLR
ncbi:MAG TPA: hypothetical protein VNP04_03910 [Alphaproteobacteria bacterium]|nr:hypothetical protein [Alphaproteobacteria bacterium]